jgi:hypothetical protein
MKNELMEMIILLNGNFAPLCIPSSEMKKYDDALAQSIRDGQGNPTFFSKPEILRFLQTI